MESGEAIISPKDNIKIIVQHTDPKVIYLVMRNPQNPQLATTLKNGVEYRLRDQEEMIRKGENSELEFVAFDRNKYRKGLIRITFIPKY